MRKMATKKRLLLAAALLAFASGGVVLAASGDEPTRPPWVGPDGAVDAAAFPEAVEVAGPDGEPVTCANGRALLVPRSMLVGPPATSPGELRRQGPPNAAGYTYRCGPGPNPHRNPIRVRVAR